jgi:hypothetical protein
MILSILLKAVAVYLIARAVWSIVGFARRRQNASAGNPSPKAPKRFDPKGREIVDAKFEEVKR